MESDVKNLSAGEEFYNEKGPPYKLPTLLYGALDSGKASLLQFHQIKTQGIFT